MVTNTQLAPEVNLTIDPAIRKPTPYQLQQIVYQNLVQHTQAFTGVCWQSSVAITDRMGKTMNLITNISLAMNEGDHLKEAKWGCNLEIEAFHKSPTKEAYNVEMEQKILEFFKLREGSEDRGNEDRRREDQHHIYTEYKKAREDTLKFVQDNLALALNFEPDGSTEKELDTGATADLAMPSSRASGSPSVPQTIAQDRTKGDKAHCSSLLVDLGKRNHKRKKNDQLKRLLVNYINDKKDYRKLDE